MLGRAIRVSILILGFLSGNAALFGDPGFGSLRKKKISLPVRRPAVVRLSNTSVAFTGSPTSAVYGPVQENLLATLATEMLANEKTLVKKASPAEAEWVLSLRLTAFSTSRPQERADTAGTNGAAYVRWKGSIRAAYQVLDHAGRSHDAGNVEYKYDKEFLSGAKLGKLSLSRMPIPGLKKAAADREPQTIEDLRDILVGAIVRQIAERLGNISRTIEAEIAVGDDHLNRAADLMENRLWSRALDELNKTPEYSKPESEAYRQYDIGLAHEAIGYDAKVLADQKKDLFEAQAYYDQALELNRKEKYFVTAVARIKDSLARYKALEGMQNSDAKNVPQRSSVAPATAPPAAAPKAQAAAVGALTGGPAKAQIAVPAVKATKTQSAAQASPSPLASKLAGAPAPAAAKPQGKMLGVADVIEMFTSHVPEGQIVDIIQHSRIQFDPLDKESAIAIARAQLPVTLQNELRKKVGAPLLGATKPSGK